MQEIKHCEICGKVIGDIYNTDWYAYISQKYCEDCRKQHDRKRKAEWAQQQRKKKKAEKKVEKEEKLLEDAKYVQERKKKARDLREERSWIRDVPTVEQELRQELRDTKRKLRDSEIRNQQYAADYINLNRRTESLEEQLKKLETSK